MTTAVGEDGSVLSRPSHEQIFKTPVVPTEGWRQKHHKSATLAIMAVWMTWAQCNTYEAIEQRSIECTIQTFCVIWITLIESTASGCQLIVILKAIESNLHPFD